MSSRDYGFLTLRNATAYQQNGNPVPPNNIFITSTNGVAKFSNTISISSFNTSTLSANIINVSTINASTFNTSTFNTNTINADIITTSTFITSTFNPTVLTTSTINTSTLSSNTINTLSLNTSSLYTSSITTDYLTSNSTINVSTLTSINIGTNSFTGSTIDVSTLTTSTITTSTLHSNTLTTSTIITITLSTSTLNTSTLNTSTLTASTINVDILNVNTEIVSTLTASTITAGAINATVLGYEAGAVNQGLGAIALGFQAGTANQGQSTVALGFKAGAANQGVNAIAIGAEAASTNQGVNAIALGYAAGYLNQQSSAIAIGLQSGNNNQQSNAIAIGLGSGFISQQSNSISIGNNTGYNSQSNSAIAIGNNAGYTSQETNTIAIGFQAGKYYQGMAAPITPIINYDASVLPLGNITTWINSGTYQNSSIGTFNPVNVGNPQATVINNGFLNEISIPNTTKMSITTTPGITYPNFTIALVYRIIIGSAFYLQNGSSNTDPLSFSMSNGYNNIGPINYNNIESPSNNFFSLTSANGGPINPIGTGTNNYIVQIMSVSTTNTISQWYLSTTAVTTTVLKATNSWTASIPTNCISTLQINNQQLAQHYISNILVFNRSFTQEQVNTLQSYLINKYFGQVSNGSIAVGSLAGYSNQGANTVAIGLQAGSTSQSQNSIALGFKAGQSTQGQSSIAIGFQAGQNNQGSQTIAIGYLAGQTNQSTNTIILNASGVTLDTLSTNALYISPIRISTNINATNLLSWDDTTKEVYAATKTFVIDHPQDKDKYLVHACLEGPEAGIYYRGKDIIQENEYTEIKLPSYVKHIASNFSIQITALNSKNEFYTTDVDEETGTFKVFGKPGAFFWHVYGMRQPINIEPLKDSVDVKGSGPYKWI